MEQDGAVPVTSLNVNELDRLRQRLQADVEHLVDSHNVLGRAVARSEAASKAVSTLAASQAGELPPLLSSSMLHHVLQFRVRTSVCMG
jgi:hypothetical protein